MVEISNAGTGEVGVVNGGRAVEGEIGIGVRGVVGERGRESGKDEESGEFRDFGELCWKCGLVGECERIRCDGEEAGRRR
jgi:hypothetical protein